MNRPVLQAPMWCYQQLLRAEGRWRRRALLGVWAPEDAWVSAGRKVFRARGGERR